MIHQLSRSSCRVRSSRGFRNQVGVGLIEVMVAVLVLSVGFLGMAALQALSLSTNAGAMARSQATMASYSILDAMRSDIVQAKSGAYNTTLAANACPAAGTSLPTTQLNQWCNQMGQSLRPIAATTGTVNCTADGVCTVTITYTDQLSNSPGAAGASHIQTIQTVAAL